MLSLSASTRIFIASGTTDLRKGFDGLCGLVSNQLKQDPLSGTLFLFVNRRRDRLKVLYWDGDGLAIWYRRLEQGTFQLPKPDASFPRVIFEAPLPTYSINGTPYVAIPIKATCPWGTTPQNER